tara:strand:- start:2434 stop:3027 length:594 start_codon:yes stop_codon:yes gene_type:complete
MGFTVNPEGYVDKTDTGSRRPDVRAGEKLAWLCGLTMGKTMSGALKIECCFVIVGDNDGGLDVRGLVFDRFPVTSAAAWKLQQVSVAAHVKKPWDAESETDARIVIGARPLIVDVELQQRNNTDKLVPNIQKYRPFPGTPTGEMEATRADAESWYKKWQEKRSRGGSGGGYSSGGGSYGGGSYSGNTGGGAEDDIPF